MNRVRETLRRSLVPCVVLASIASTFAGECSPDLANYTPTPTLSWSQSDPSNTAGYRVYWKKAEDMDWRGSIDLPIWPGDATSGPVYPGITEPFPLQRLIPRTAQRLLVDVRVTAYDKSNQEGLPTRIMRVCMPELWSPGVPYR